MFKRAVYILFFLVETQFCFSQFVWSGYQNALPNSRGRTFLRDAYTYSTTASGVTMNATISHTGGNMGSDITNTSGSCSTGSTNQIGTTLEYFSTGTVDPCFYYSPPSYNAFAINGMWLGVDWPNASHEVTIDMSFSAYITNPSFIIADINQGANFSDKVIISALDCSGATVFPSSVVNLNSPFTYTAGTGTIENTSSPSNSAMGNGTPDLQTTVTFASTVTSIKIVYKSSATPPAANPTYQYILLGQINFSAGPTPLTITPTIPSCGANTATLTASPGWSSYSWTTSAPGSIGSPSTASTSISGYSTYTVTASMGGCPPTSVSYVFSAAVASTPPSLGTLTGGSIYCAGGTTTISTSATGTTYSWSGPGIVSGGTTATPTVNAVGTYTVNLVSTLNSCTNSGTATVTLAAMPVVTITLTCGASACSRYQFTSSVTPAVAGATYQWQQSSSPSSAAPPVGFTNIGGATAVNFTGGNGGLACGFATSYSNKWIRLQVTIPGCPPIYSTTSIFTTNSSTGCALVVLPIELITFSGKCVGNEKTFEWSTATEINNNYFTLEASTDGETFIPKLKIDGAGFSNNLNYYTKSFIESNHQFSYYRLKQTDYNGEFAYSKVIYVSCENETNWKNNIFVYPNPACNQISIEFGELFDSDLTIFILDALGREVKSLNVLANDASLTNIDINEFTNGVYFIRVAIPNKETTIPLLKFIKVVGN